MAKSMLHSRLALGMGFRDREQPSGWGLQGKLYKVVLFYNDLEEVWDSDTTEMKGGAGGWCSHKNRRSLTNSGDRRKWRRRRRRTVR